MIEDVAQDTLRAYLLSHPQEPYSAVARRFGVSRQWVHTVASRLGLGARRARRVNRQNKTITVNCDFCGISYVLEGRRRASYVYEHTAGKSKSTMCPACFTTLGPHMAAKIGGVAWAVRMRQHQSDATPPPAETEPAAHQQPDAIPLLSPVQRWLRDDELTSTDVALLFGVSEQTVTEWCEQGRLPATLVVLEEQARWTVHRGGFDGCPIIADAVADSVKSLAMPHDVSANSSEFVVQNAARDRLSKGRAP